MKNNLYRQLDNDFNLLTTRHLKKFSEMMNHNGINVRDLYLFHTRATCVRLNNKLFRLALVLSRSTYDE